MRDLPQAVVERAEPGVDVVEAPAHALPEVVGDHRGDLGRRLPQLVGERDDLLQRPVVQVVAEAQEAPLAGSHEVVLALHSAVEQGCALEERRERVRGLVEVVLEVLGLGAASAGDERRVRPVPTLDDPDVHLGRAGGDAVECRASPPPAGGGCAAPCRARRGTWSSRQRRGSRASLPRRVRARRAARARAPRRPTGGSWANSLLASARTEDREGRSLGWQPELVGRGRDRGTRIARLEPVLDRDRDDRVAEEVERSTLAPAVG